MKTHHESSPLERDGIKIFGNRYYDLKIKFTKESEAE
jgi:hypothetical protein